MRGLLSIVAMSVVAVLLVCVITPTPSEGAGLLSGGLLGGGGGGGLLGGLGGQSQNQNQACEGGNCTNIERGPTLDINRSIKFGGRETTQQQQQAQETREPEVVDNGVSPVVVALAVPLILTVVLGAGVVGYFGTRKSQEGG